MSARQSFSRELSSVMGIDQQNVYQLIVFETMHVFNPEISREVKKCPFRRLRSEKLLLREPIRTRQTYGLKRTATLPACNEMLKRVQREWHVFGQPVDYSSNDSSNALNGLITSEGICGMLEAKNFRHIDSVFPFVVAFIGRTCGEKDGIATTISTLYFDIMTCVKEQPLKELWTDEMVSKSENVIRDFQVLLLSHLGRH